MIYRLEYCNKAGVTARLDIVKGALTPIEVIEGTAEPFILNYKMDKGDNSGFIMSSNADISVFESGTFNIDNLKTSSETELKVNHYIDGVLKWSGFILPDFFSRIVGSPAIVEMVATDRLGALKAATIEPSTQYSKIRDLLISCLAKTGLTLPLMTMLDFEFSTPILWVGDNVFSLIEIPSQRLVTPRGQRINCYDIVKAILVGSNARIVQKDGQWHIYNKMQHALGDGRVYSGESVSTLYAEEIIDFDDVEVGARRTLQPVAASVGVFHEFAGGLTYPENFDFRDGLSGWASLNATLKTTNLIEFEEVYIDEQQQIPFFRAAYGADSAAPSVLISHTDMLWDSAHSHIRYSDIGVVSAGNETKLAITVNVASSKIALLPVMVLLNTGSETMRLNNNGVFVSGGFSTMYADYFIAEIKEDGAGNGEPIYKSFTFEGKIEAFADGDNINDYTVDVLVMGSGLRGASGPPLNRLVKGWHDIVVNSVAVEFSDTTDIGKGILYKREQGDDYTKQHDIDTTIFGDHITKGLNGYFYGIRRDEKAAITENFDGVRRRNHVWRTKFDTEGLPLLQHIAREKSRLFSETHDLLTATIEVQNFNPLAIFRACGSKRFTVVNAKFDYFRSKVELTLEEIAISSNTVREYIYSYFGDGDGDKVASISGVSAASGSGSTGGGGGSWLEQFFTVNEDGTVLTANVNLFSEGELAAYANTDTAPNMWDALPVATETKLGGIRAASIYQNGIRINANGFLEIDPTYGGGGGEVGVSSWNDLTDKPIWLTPTTLAAFEAAHGHDWSQIASKPATATRWPAWTEVTSKPTTFTPAAHTQAISTITGLQNALDGKAALAGSSTQNFTVKDLTIHGTVNHWLADVITIDDARLQLNRRQDGATVESGLTIFNKDTGLEVSKLVYGTDNRWKLGAENIATENWVENTATVYNSARLGGVLASDYARKSQNEVVTGAWNFRVNGEVLRLQQVTASQSLFIRGADETGTNLWYIGRPSGGSLDIGYMNYSNAGLWFGTNSAQRVRIDEVGNMGVGVITDIAERLHVAGNGLFEGSLRIGGSGRDIFLPTIRIRDNNAKILVVSAEGDGQFIFRPGGDTFSPNQTKINNSGISTVGLTASGSGTFGGNVTAQGEVTAYSSSDIRLKRDVLPITNALDIIEKLNPVRYRWNKKAIALNSAKDDRINYGLIAQQLEDVLPDLVHQTNGYKSVDYIQLIGILLAGVRELRKEVNQLKQSI
jgi:hypothetical protein